LFSEGGGKRAAGELDVPFLGALPIAPDMPEHCDKGQPYVLAEEKHELKDAFKEMVNKLIEAVEKNNKGCSTGAAF
jgi:MinD-like ATPase involved in chromosome partitioning or flagellar assembly